jgi:hypothetical protein
MIIISGVKYSFGEFLQQHGSFWSLVWSLGWLLVRSNGVLLALALYTAHVQHGFSPDLTIIILLRSKGSFNEFMLELEVDV